MALQGALDPEGSSLVISGTAARNASPTCRRTDSAAAACRETLTRKRRPWPALASAGGPVLRRLRLHFFKQRLRSGQQPLEQPTVYSRLQPAQWRVLATARQRRNVRASARNAASLRCDSPIGDLRQVVVLDLMLNDIAGYAELGCQVRDHV